MTTADRLMSTRPEARDGAHHQQQTPTGESGAPSLYGRPRFDRRAVLGSLAVATVAVACDGGDAVSPEQAGDSRAGEERGTVVDPSIGRIPEALPLYDEGATTSTSVAPDVGATSTTDGAGGGWYGGTAPTSPPSVPPPTATSTTVSSTTTPSTQVTQPSSQPTSTVATTTTLAGTAPGRTANKPSTTTPGSVPISTQPIDTPTTTTTPPPPPPEATVLLMANRATFGTTPEVQAEITRSGIAGWVDSQLSLSGPDPAVEAQLGAFRTLGISRQAMYAIAQEQDDPIQEELVHSSVIRARSSRHQLFEMMAHFWMDHFNVHLDSGRWKHLHIDYQENVIRPNALGRFSDLLRATAEAPAMLVYLDNADSNANSSRGVNENYGRELLELHTLGIDPAGNQIYDETDVRGVSYIMSGWSVERDRDAADYSDFEYRDDYHWTETVTILGGGFSSADLAQKAAGDALLLFLARHPTTARHLAYKLIRRFVSDDPPASLITSTAQVYLANDTALVPTLRHILLSPEFAASTGLKLRRPFELVSAAMRALDSSVPTDPRSGGANTVRSRLRDLNHAPWTWDQPDGFADEAGPWLSSDGLLERWEFTSRLANNYFGDDPDDIRTDLAPFASAASTVGELITDLQDRFGLPGVTQPQKDAMTTILDVAETDPVGSLDQAEVGELACYLLAHPQFQVR